MAWQELLKLLKHLAEREWCMHRHTSQWLPSSLYLSLSRTYIQSPDNGRNCTIHCTNTSTVGNLQQEMTKSLVEDDEDLLWFLVGEGDAPGSSSSNGNTSSLLPLVFLIGSWLCFCFFFWWWAAGDLVCSWGRGEDGQLGHGDAEERHRPTIVNAHKNNDISAITCGADHTTAYSNSTKTVYSWGW